MILLNLLCVLNRNCFKKCIFIYLYFKISTQEFNNPTIILFSSDSEILNSIDENYIINVNNQKREINLVETYNYKALILN